MKFGYVCTNFNNSNFTCEAVRSLQRNLRHEFQVVVVDNQSAAESVEQLVRFADGIKNLELILNKENMGYFKGLNAGINLLRERHTDLDVIVVGNNDLEFPEDFGDALEKNIETIRRYPVVSPNIITLDGVHQNPHVISNISKFREVVYDIYYWNYYLAVLIRKLAKATLVFSDRSDELDYQTAQTIYQGHGACYILGPRFFTHFTELWAPTFLMGEEFFLSRQLAEKGFKKFYEPSIVIRHHCHGAIDKIPSKTIWEISRSAHRVYRRYVRILG